MGKYRDFLLWGTLYVYIVLYMFVYLAFIFIISMIHSSYSMVSVLAVSLPFILLFVIQWIILHFSVGDNKGTYKRRFKGITILGAIVFSICIVQLGVNEYNSKFHADRWLKNEQKRVYMVDDLLAKHKLVGKSKKEIIQILGYPTETRRFEEMTQTLYYLGDERGFISIDSECLVLQFDNNDKIIEYTIQKD
ncbi:hypothetical protein [Bacillus bingmayongensis]|uniref:hypothetical protein n=1 Tax=Bacillus bingmayongensis TaxID=1150157 RepID=UPI0002DEF9B1|nr:hypothetical protein [Bacillus bingmayongensis]